MSLALLAGCTHKNSSSTHDMSPHHGNDMSAGVDMSLAGDLGGLVDLAGSDGPSCGAQGAMCTTASGGAGLCNAGSGVCGCGGASADSDCNAAYGGTTQYVCIAGACVPGNCSSSASCSAGLQCASANCSPCTGSGASDTCKSDPVYGNSYECVNGFCIVGNCLHDSDCAGTGGNTKLCLNNNCAACTSDLQCQSDTDTTGSGGVGSLCNTTTGVCVKNPSCTVTGSGIAAEEAACAAYNNGNDICCGGKCVSGNPDPSHEINCCTATGTSDCSASPGNPTCQATSGGAGICSQCTAPTASGNPLTTTYYIDPASGDDSRGTGNQAENGCGFATIRRALQVIGGSPPNAVVLLIAIGTKTLANTPTAPVPPNGPRVIGEQYPLVIPANVSITTEENGGNLDVTVNVPATQTINGNTVATTAGFVFTGKNSGLSNVTVSGGNAVGVGIDVQGYTPVANQPVTLGDVLVTGFTAAGVRVEAPSAAPANPQLLVTGGSNGGSSFDQNGNDTIAGNGMIVLGSAAVTETDTGRRVTFSGNGGFGILVARNGQLALTGSSGTTAPTQDTAVVLANNKSGGLVISQTPSLSTPPLNVIKGVTITATGTGPSGTTFTNLNAHGLRVTGGSAMSLHTSLIYGQAKGSGVRVEDYHGPLGIVVSDVSHISLGASGNPGGDAGNNLLQGTGGSLPLNEGAGVCLAITANLGQTLKALGNSWGTTDCTMTTAKLSQGSNCNTGLADYTINGKQTSNPNKLDVTMCQ